MAEKKTETITINDVVYQVENLSDEQKTLINHVADLDRKLGSAKFSVDQLTVGRDAFMAILTKSLDQLESEAA